MSCPHVKGSADLILEQCIDPSSASNPEFFLTRHANFDWYIDFASKSISGSVSLHMIPLDLYTASDGILILDIKDIEVSKILKNNTEAKWSIREGSNPDLGDSLRIEIPRQTERFTLTINYKTLPQASALQWLETEMTADKVRPFLFTQCQAIHARSLFPCQDTPRVKFTYTATIHAPAGATVLMSALSSPLPFNFQSPPNCCTYVFSQNIPIPSYLVALACGELQSIVLGPRSKVWAEPGVITRACHEFCEVEPMIAAAERLCGPYEWTVYDILVLPPSFPFGGMENPCLTFVTPCLLAGDRSLVSTIVHEITHSWTGNLVTNASWEHFWLNEGHTKYVEGLILEILHGTDYRELFIELGYEELQECLEAFGEGHPFTKLIPCMEDVNPDDSFSIIPYQKGSLLLYFLEEKYGKAKMLSWLRAYVARFSRHSLNTRTWMDFLASQIDANVINDVNWNAWLYMAGPIPWKPNFKRVLSSVCDDVVKAITTEPLGSNADAAAFVRATYTGLIPLQKLLVLQRLLFKLPLHHDNLRVLDSMLAISQSTNSEIRYRWSLICLRSQYLPGLDSALEFLNGQGRVKFTRPIYRALMSWPAIKQQSVNNFKAHRQFMHPTTAKVVEQDIGLF